MSAGLGRRRLVGAAHGAIASSPALAFASHLLGLRRRNDLWLLHGWCRAGVELVARPDAESAIVTLRDKTEAALHGERLGDAPFDGLALLIRERGLPADYPRRIVDGLAMDAADFRPRDEADLYGYCHLVGGLPAALAAIACGVRPDEHATLARAADLGIGCRLVTIARDVSADAAAGRCYLPDSWLSEMDIPPGEHMKPPYRKRLAVLAERLGERAEAFMASARPGLAALSFRPAWAALTVIALHRDILEDVVARGAHGWDHRAEGSGAERIDKAMISAVRALLRGRLYAGEEVEPPWRADD
jgi:phytoene synthase